MRLKMVAPRILPTTSLPKAALAKRAAKSYAVPKQNRMTRGRWITAIAVLMLICVGVAWCAGWIGPDPRLAEVRSLQEKLGDRSLTEDQRRVTFQELGQKMRDLPENLRRKLFEEGMRGRGPGSPRGPGFGVSPTKLLAMPEDKRNAELDKMLDRMVDGMKQIQQMAKNGQGGPPGGPGPGGRSGGGPPGPPGGGPGGSPNQWRNQMLSSVPADARASFGLMRQLMQARAMQRGITLPQGPPGGPPR
jgi:hypothetical protein